MLKWGKVIHEIIRSLLSIFSNSEYYQLGDLSGRVILLIQSLVETTFYHIYSILEFHGHNAMCPLILDKIQADECNYWN